MIMFVVSLCHQRGVTQSVVTPPGLGSQCDYPPAVPVFSLAYLAKPQAAMVE